MRAILSGLVVLALGAPGALAQDDGAGPSGASGGLLDAYFRMVDRAQADQPHWISPLVTTTPRLNERFRYDVSWQSRPQDVELVNYGSSKGLEIIAFDRFAVTFGIPAYEVRRGSRGTVSGWADETVQVKYRLLSANEENGNYVLTGFVGVSVPTGSDAFTAGATVYTPTIAWGKGWGTRSEGFDIQSTLAVSVPGSDEARVGMPVVWNTAFQGHVFHERFWPEVEMSLTHWTDGPNDGRWQAIATVGCVLGRFPISGRLRLDLGAGYQFAVSRFRTYDPGWVTTVRLPF